MQVSLKLARKLLALLEKKPNPTVIGVDLYDALIMLINAWNEVSSETIRNCFIEYGLRFTENEIIGTEEVDDNEYDYSVLHQLTERMGLQDSGFEDFVNFDNDIAVNDEENITENE
jgi:hypothetical protein